MNRTIHTQEYQRAIAVAYSIRSRSNKKPTIMFLCTCLKAILTATKGTP